MDEAVAGHLRQRPGEHLGRSALERRLGRRLDPRPQMRIGAVEHEAGEIMLLRNRIAEPLGHRRRRRPAPPAPLNHPIVVLKLEHVEKRRGPAGRHIGPGDVRRRQHARQVDEQQALGPRRLLAHRRAQGGGRGREARARGVERRLLRFIQRPVDDRDRHRREGRHGRRVVEADAAVRRHPPPGLADLEAHRQSRVAQDAREGPSDEPQIAHRPGVRRRQQSRRRLPCRERRRALQVALLPVVPAMLVEQLVGEREDRAKPERRGPRREVAVPGGAGAVEHSAREADVKGAAHRLEPEIMAHPDIMAERTAIA